MGNILFCSATPNKPPSSLLPRTASNTNHSHPSLYIPHFYRLLDDQCLLLPPLDLDKHGEFEKLKFPAFHKELLSQSYWNPGDDLGRVKIVIAEGFTRDHLTYPFERVKNIVSFSFQHAPLDVLEASSIAWPNASMWRHVSLMGPYFSQAASPRGEAIMEHGHSPRHPSTLPGTFSTSKVGSMLPPTVPVLPRQHNYDPFTEPVHAAFRGWRQTSTDLSMPDCSDPSTRSNSTCIVPAPQAVLGGQ